MLAPDNLRAHLKRAERYFAPTRAQLHNRSLHEDRWLQRSVPGFCGLTTINGDCAFGSKGSWPLHGARGDNWSAAVKYGLGRCAHCARCDTISVTLQHRFELSEMPRKIGVSVIDNRQLHLEIQP